MCQTLTLITPDARMAAILPALLSPYALPCEIMITDQTQRQAAPEKSLQINTPIRLGYVIDRIHHALNKPADGGVLRFGAASLDTVQYIFTAPHIDGGRVKLTEKEAALLTLLHHNNGAAVSRDALLQDIWGYADDVETHTLETHIYRLRQKIEHDSSSPAILITRDDGYAVHV